MLLSWLILSHVTACLCIAIGSRRGGCTGSGLGRTVPASGPSALHCCTVWVPHLLHPTGAGKDSHSLPPPLPSLHLSSPPSIFHPSFPPSFIPPSLHLSSPPSLHLSSLPPSIFHPSLPPVTVLVFLFLSYHVIASDF